MDRTPADRPEHPRAAERFNEERATDAVRGVDQPNLEKGVAAIREVLKTLPRRPGVYRMRDPRRRPLRRQGPGIEEPSDQLHAGFQASQTPSADGFANTLDDDRHNPDRTRGASP